jgi:acyl carrier protein
MQRHPAVIESATVGLPDEMFGEIAVTGVTLNTEVSEVDLTAHLRAQIEPRKVSKRIISLPAIPRGLSGKPMLSELKQRLIEATGIGSGANAGPELSDTPEMTDAILNVAAEVFRVPVETLSPQSHPDDVPGWDSFTHLNLIFGVEQRLGVRLTAAQVSRIRHVGDLIEAVETAK